MYLFSQAPVLSALAIAAFDVGLAPALDVSDLHEGADKNIVLSSTTGTASWIEANAVRNAALDYTSASWIWTSEATTVASRPFRYTHASTTGKSTSFAVCQATADNIFDLYIDGRYVGSNDNWMTSKRFYADLNPQSNVFAANVTNVGGPAGFILACRIVYTDGTIDSIVTDKTWKTVQSAPAVNFQSPLVDDSNWAAATDQGRYGVPPWGTQASFAESPLPPVPSLTTSRWMWTREMTSPNSNVPIGSRPFRRTFGFRNTKVAKYATVLISADNLSYLWVNGRPVGATLGWNPANRFVANLAGAKCCSPISFAIEGMNVGGPAALLFSAQVVYDDGSWDVVVSDANWKTLRTEPPVNFMDPAFSDDSWETTVDLGVPGIAPWGPITVPAI